MDEKESGRGCCVRTCSPVSPSRGKQLQNNRYHSSNKEAIEKCNVRKCKYGKSQIQNELCNTQKILDKVQNLKKSIQELESVQQQFKPKSVEKREVPCQTQDFTPSDLHNIQDLVNNCIAEMTRLKTFLDDENCWWKIFKKRQFSCCEQKSPHLHGFLDGTMVTLKMLEENVELDKDFSTSTPVRASKKDSERRTFKAGNEDEERCGKKYANASANTRRTIDFNCAASDPGRCSKSNTVRGQSTPIRGHSNIALDESTAEQRPMNWLQDNRTSRDQPAEPAFYSMADGSGLSGDGWYRKNSMNIGIEEGRPSVTFSSENTEGRRVIATDISTSMEALPSMTEPMAGIQDITERSFSVSPGRSQPRGQRSSVRK